MVFIKFYFIPPGNAKIFVLSFFKLVADVKPAFVIYDPKMKRLVDDQEDLRFKIKQPNKEDCSVFNQCVLIFTAPQQDWEVIKKIKQLGYELHVTAYRLFFQQIEMIPF